METAKNIEVIREDFEELFNLYKTLKTEINLLEGKNGYIQQIFDEWRKQTEENMDYNNILLNQEKVESLKKHKHTNNALRFYTPYYHKYVNAISKGIIPYFLKSKEVNLAVDLSFNKFDTKSYLNALKQFSTLSNEQRVEEKAKILKALSIVYARQANIFNRLKKSKKIEFIEAIRK